jgi:hypothetical protein
MKNTKKEKLLNDTYQKWMQIGLYDLPLDDANDFVDPEIMGYGTAIDEKVLSISDFHQLINRQREQAVGLEMNFENTPVFRSISNKEDSAFFVDEIKVSIILKEGIQELFLRMTTILEYVYSKWIVVHWHGSIPTETMAETDTWLVNEWKRENEKLQKLVDEKTFELLNKNRELEIEASLEKVRTIAMAMRKPDDMLEVCKTISLQLEFLGVTEIRNVQTAIFYQQSGTYTNYEYYAKHDKTFITETTYTNNELHQEFAQKMLKGKGEFFITHIKGKEVIDWIAYQKTTNVFIDNYLETASSLNYYWFSLGPVALGISTYQPLTEEEINLFKRFLKVFELSYQRYLDIENAESQAREARIETALERVRAKAMSMRHSSELSLLIYDLYKELTQLDARLDRCLLLIVNPDNLGITWWLSGKEGLLAENGFFVKNNEHPSHLAYLDGWRYKKKKWQYLLEGEEKKAWDAFGFKETELALLPDFIKQDMIAVERIHLSISSDNFGSLIASSLDPLKEEHKEIVNRFANVFELTYTRFLDLQKAEARAREAQIEAALERVRSRTMGMQRSDELQQAAVLLFQQVVSLGVPAFGTGFNIWDDDRKFATAWMGGHDRMQPPFKTSTSEDIFLRIYKTAERGESLFVEEQGGEALNIHYEYMNSIPVFKEIADKMAAVGQTFPTFQIMHCAFFSQGYLMFITFEPVPDAYEIFKRFAKVFEQTYTRFLDLQKAEKQAREAQIELSLERIRAQVTAMKESSDLLDIVVTMRNEFVALGHEAHYFWHMRYLPDKYEKAMTSGDGTRIGMVMELPRHIHGEIKLLADWEKSDDPTVVYAMDVDAALEYVDKMINLGDFKLVDPNAPTHDDIRHIGGLTFVMARTTHGEIGYSLPGIVTNPPAEDLNTLVRFSGVFDLAYKRFEDLKGAERQQREVQIELALERTRTQSMLMKHSNELNDISKTFHEQLLGLGIDSEFSFVWLPYEDKQEHMFWATWVNNVNGATHYKSKAVIYPLDKTEPGTAKCYMDWESNQTVHETFVPPDQIDSFFASWEELLSGAVKFKPEFFPEGIYYTEAYMKYGCFGIDIRRPITQEEKEILRRFSVEFERTYTRFLDLQKSEEQNKIIQAENDRKSLELEEARKLQFAMLPKQLPQLSKLDIAVYMQTATEVGGDYYDFSTKDNGSLNICIGDATGHGLKAGTLVSMMKSLFVADSVRLDIKEFFNSSNETLKKMSLSKMMIAFAMVNIYGRQIKIANAGIPPVFIFRKEKNIVEEVNLHGLPIGAMRNAKYEVYSSTVNIGDAIILLSDGLPELKNKINEMYGYQRLKEVFIKNVGKTSDEIISALENESRIWRGEREQDDDITFVVIKIK